MHNYCLQSVITAVFVCIYNLTEDGIALELQRIRRSFIQVSFRFKELDYDLLKTLQRLQNDDIFKVSAHTQLLMRNPSHKNKKIFI